MDDPIGRGLEEIKDFYSVPSRVGRIGRAAEDDLIPETAARVLFTPGRPDLIATIEAGEVELEKLRDRIRRARAIAYDELDYDTPTLHRIVHALDGTDRR